MSILLGTEIKEAIKNKEIFVSPYNEKNVSINSIDVTLSKNLTTYQKVEIIKDKNGNNRIQPVEDLDFIDMKAENKVYEIEIPEDGLIIVPGILYLGSTVEKAGSAIFVPMYEGRSSMARLGIQSHISAGFGDLGFQSNWTLEINVVHPVKIYPNIRIGQVFFHRVEEDAVKQQSLYNGKYVSQEGPKSSDSYKDF